MPPTSQILTATSSWQTLSTPEFPVLIGGLNCVWSIRATYGDQIVISVGNVTIVADGGNPVFQVRDTSANSISFT
jgi:hypothetical protein